MKEITRDEIKALFRDNFRSLRIEAGLSQSDLARRIGAMPSYICDLERGCKHPTLGTIAVLADALGVTPATLVSTVRANQPTVQS